MLNELAKLKQIISIQLNIDRSCIDKKSREKEYVRARVIYSNILMKELQIPIGKMSQYLKKDRSSFYHYQKQHDTAYDLPRFYQDYIDDYERVKEMFLGEQDVMLKRWEVEFEKLSKARAEINYRLDKLEKEMSSVH